MNDKQNDNQLSRITREELKLLINHLQKNARRELNQFEDENIYEKRLNADLDQFLPKDPDDRLYEKFIRCEGGVCAKRDIQQGEFLALYWCKKITGDEFCRMSDAGNAE